MTFNESVDADISQSRGIYYKNRPSSLLGDGAHYIAEHFGDKWLPHFYIRSGAPTLRGNSSYIMAYSKVYIRPHSLQFSISGKN